MLSSILPSLGLPRPVLASLALGPVLSVIAMARLRAMGMPVRVLLIDEFSEVILKSKTILWNGPMGVF